MYVNICHFVKFEMICIVIFVMFTNVLLYVDIKLNNVSFLCFTLVNWNILVLLTVDNQLFVCFIFKFCFI